MKIYTIAQQKGGTGKTTTAAAIGLGLLNKGNRVLFIDLDPQGNLSYILGADTTAATTLDLLKNTTTARKAAQPLPRWSNGAIIPYSPLLAGADATITGRGREFIIKEGLKRVKGFYDYCIIDTPPALGILTVNALTAADGVIIPCQADILSLQALSQITSTIQGIQATTNPQLKIEGVLLTRYNNRQILTRQIADAIESVSHITGGRVFNTRIRESVSIRESQATGEDIYTHAPRSNGAKDYNALIDELTTKKG